jgi:XTP/dITP diphosphohydrolase
MPHNSMRVRSELVVATANAGKLREFRSLLAGLPFEVRGLVEFGLSSPAETGASFAENALLKARHAADTTGSAALGDDSGLEVDALGGAPGIYSARYAGLDFPDAGRLDSANNAKLLGALSGTPPAERTARYRCALAFVRGPADPLPVTAEASWEGIILEAPRGAGGFGYDPYFWLPQLGMTAAELASADKNRLSHRGRALAALRRALEGTLHQTSQAVGQSLDPAGTFGEQGMDAFREAARCREPEAASDPLDEAGGAGMTPERR